MAIVNLITNPEFETDLTGYLQEFSGTYTRITDDTYTGVAAMEVVCDNTADGGNPQRNRYDVLPYATNGKTITAAAVVKGTGTWRMLVTEMDNVGTVLATTFSDPFTLTSAYTEYSATRVCDQATGAILRWGIQLVDDNTGEYTANVGYALLYEGEFEPFLTTPSAPALRAFNVRTNALLRR